MGAHLNAYTSREQTVYYAKAFSKDLPRGNCSHSSVKLQRTACLSSFQWDDTEWCFCIVRVPSFHPSRWKVHFWTSQEREITGLGSRQQGSWYFKFFSIHSPRHFRFLSSCPLCSLISTCTLGWVSVLEPDFSSSLKILFSFPSVCN